MKNIYAVFFTMWDLKMARTCKCRRAVLSRTSVNVAKLALFQFEILGIAPTL